MSRLKDTKRFFKNSKAGFKFLKAKLLGQKLPLFVSWQLTLKCNIFCSYCAIDRYHNDHPELNTEQALQMIREMADAGTCYLMLSGGEPLVRKDIDVLVNEAVKRGLIVCMSSNGDFVPKKIETVKKLDYITISLDGNKESHDKARGEGTFDTTVRGIEAACNAGVKVFTTTVVGYHNVKDLDFIFEFSKKMGTTPRFQLEASVNVVGIDEVVHYKEKAQRTGEKVEVLTDKDSKDILRYLGNKCEADNLSLISKNALKFVLNWPDNRFVASIVPLDGVKPIKCYAGRFHMYINPDGRLLSCCVLPSDNVVLSVTEGFEKAFDQLSTPQCIGCTTLPLVEMNLWCDMDMESLWNLGKRLVPQFK